MNLNFLIQTYELPFKVCQGVSFLISEYKWIMHALIHMLLGLCTVTLNVNWEINMKANKYFGTALMPCLFLM